MTITTDQTAARAGAPSARAFYITAWRWHFYAGLYVAPFLIMLAVTGLVMLWSSVLVGRDGEKYHSVTPAAETLAVSRQAEAALSAVPDGSLVQYIVPRTPEQAALFRVNAGDRSLMVAVDPYRGTVLGSWPRRDALYDLANTIHGTLMIGVVGDRLIEIAAGFGVVLIVTGLYLWWPREARRGAAAFAPQLSLKGRNLWKSLHQTVGIYVSVLLLAFLLSGLTWAGIWGERMTQAWSTFPAEKWDNVPLSDATHASMNHGGVKTVPWTLEQTPMPASGSDAGTPGIADGQPVDVDGVVALARASGFDGRFQLSYPSGDEGVWTIARDTMSNDSANPFSDRTLHVDRYSGKVLADVGFADYGVAGKAMAVGIALHEGDIGAWNVALNTVFCLSVVFLSASGIVMWWKRRPAGAARLVAPALPEKMALWKTGAIVMVAVSLLFPLTGAVLVGVLLLDLVLVRHVRPLKRAIS
ncbi:PepSY-associated TM helix domain-containing protein [Ensifer soli]|uniref:PepSY-associated TM helix domain-containing protein n=1 Tax=Ciceribacter sp. sgz301302 TaxID=3342379 RepID=UPI0035BB9162